MMPEKVSLSALVTLIVPPPVPSAIALEIVLPVLLASRVALFSVTALVLRLVPLDPPVATLKVPPSTVMPVVLVLAPDRIAVLVVPLLTVRALAPLMMPEKVSLLPLATLIVPPPLPRAMLFESVLPLALASRMALARVTVLLLRLVLVAPPVATLKV